MKPGWLTALSMVLCGTAIAVYALLLRVPAIRNHPEGYVAVFALVLFAGGAAFNFVLARIPDAQTNLRLGERPPDFTLPDAGGRPVSLADYRGTKPVVLVFYRGYW